jgi:hypothetical protein
MKRTIVVVAAGSALAAGILGSAGSAEAAPSGPASVTQTVAGLRSHGYTVIVNGAKGVSLDQCTMYAIRPGHTFTRMDSGSGLPGEATDIVTTVVSMTVYVDAYC